MTHSFCVARSARCQAVGHHTALESTTTLMPWSVSTTWRHHDIGKKSHFWHCWANSINFKQKTHSPLFSWCWSPLNKNNIWSGFDSQLSTRSFPPFKAKNYPSGLSQCLLVYKIHQLYIIYIILYISIYIYTVYIYIYNTLVLVCILYLPHSPVMCF